MVDQPLSDSRQSALRKNGIISESEIALKVGDLHVAQNIVTGERRAIIISATVLETKQILRD
tara:strand:+ start:267 stop:452 length:186 start_codon:yes stop_codon:yes gene_type:complete